MHAALANFMSLPKKPGGFWSPAASAATALSEVSLPSASAAAASSAAASWAAISAENSRVNRKEKENTSQAIITQ
jgi:hypothetical protein